MTDGVLSASERSPGHPHSPVGAVLVVGGGIGGIQASLDLADSGFKVYLVEKDLSIGGTMSQLDKTFPTNDCAMCIMSPKLVEAGRHRNIEILSLSRVERVEGGVGAFRVLIRRTPRYVDLQKCTACGDCARVCPVRLPNDYEEGLVTRRAIYQPFAQSMPSAFGIDKRGTPPCRAACPIHVNAQGYIALIIEEKYEEALALVRERNPFPAITGRICTHPCETACRRGEVDQPVAINGLKRFLADRAGETPMSQSPRPEHREQIAVVGSGPAGLLAAHDLRQMGYGVTVFEALPVLGGMLSVGIPEYRLPRHVVNSEVGTLQQLGVKFRVNTRVGSNVTLTRLRERYQAVFLAVGAHISHRLAIDGENLEGVIHATDYLRRVNLGDTLPVGQRVVVVGGGNAAIDAARVARRHGASRVIILYRRSREEMPALPEEIEAAESEGIIIELLAAPVRIQGKNDHVEKAVCVRMKLGEPDDSGRRRPVPVQGSHFTIELDTLILAIGQTPDLTFIHHQDPLKITHRGTIEVDPVTLETSARGVFAGGDAVTGPLTYIDAIAAGRKAAVSIDRYLRGQDLGTSRENEGPQTDYVLAGIEDVA